MNLLLDTQALLWWKEGSRKPAELKRDGFVMLDVTVDHAVAVGSLPEHHDDPFDRLLIAQARQEGLTVVTSDTAFDAYAVQVLDARA